MSHENATNSIELKNSKNSSGISINCSSSGSGSSCTLPEYSDNNIEMTATSGDTAQTHNGVQMAISTRSPSHTPEVTEEEHDWLESLLKILRTFMRRYSSAVAVVLFAVYNAFFVYAITRSWNKTKDWASGVKLLALLTGITYTCMAYRLLIKPNKQVLRKLQFCSSKQLTATHRRAARILAWAIVLLAILAYIGTIAFEDPIRLRSAAGYLGFVGLVFAFSKHKKHIKWNQILWGLTIQILFGIFVLRTTIGRLVFDAIGQKINAFLNFTQAGTSMVFGYLATGQLQGPNGNVSAVVNGENVMVEFENIPMPIQASIFAFHAMPVVIFFSFFVAILYYYGIMQIIVKQLGWLLQITIGTTACESISASGNIFLGMTESPLLVKPFLSRMTKSELHVVLTGGFATIAGSVMAAYISFGISPTHLLSASVMAAPSALALSKLMYPETEESKTTVNDIKLEKGQERNAIEAASNGASTAIGLVANIVANLIAFMAFLAFLDSILSWIGEMIDAPELSFKFLLSKLLLPVALMLGVDWKDAEKVASLVGVKMVVNEFVAYQNLSQMVSKSEISKRSETIATFALCSFANFSSIGIQVGGLSAMAPSRKSDLAQLALRAMLTGTACSFLTACLAGTLY